MAETNLKSPLETSPEARRRKMISERQRNSVFWQIVHILGSLKLALLLLFTIALACAAATFAESNFNTKIAQVYIYKNPLFTLWLVVLCVNLFCVTLTRWPWQRRHAGFIITHYGIITLLIGAMIGRATGYEAFITLNKGEAPKSILSSNDPILFVENPHTGLIGTVPFEAEVSPPTPSRPRIFPVEGAGMEIVVDQYSEKLSVFNDILDDPLLGLAPGVSLRLSSAAMKQSLDVPLIMQNKDGASFDMFGLAKIEWLEKLPPPPDPKAPARAKPATYRESQMVFARQPGIPVVHNTSGTPSGYRFTLLPKSNGPGFDLEIVFPDSRRQVVDLQQALKKPVPGQQAPTEIVVARYWPDLRMVDGKPVSVSDEPNNPAALVTFSGILEDPSAKTPRLLLAPLDADRVRYQFRRGPTVTSEGELARGTRLPTGWNDWTVELKNFSPRARMVSVARESTADSPVGGELVPGLRFYFRSSGGKSSEPRWIAKGTSDTLVLGDKRVRVGYGNRIIPIPFGVSLADFQVPRDEGTSTPANFISSIRFHPADSSAPISARSEMNFPASYPEGLWGQFTGFTHKFSQAGWNPQNLNETTLQVLHDPGWSLKWIGSLMICGGIFTMFYLKPKKTSPAPKPSNSEASS